MISSTTFVLCMGLAILISASWGYYRGHTCSTCFGQRQCKQECDSWAEKTSQEYERCLESRRELAKLERERRRSKR